jgi:hypothetical protein
MSKSFARGCATALLIALPLVVTTTGAQGVSGSEDRTVRAEQAAQARPTPFALKTRGFGTKVEGGEVPAGSAPTAFQRIGCTNKAGKTKRSSEADVDVPGLGVVSGVTTTLRTIQRKGTVASQTVQRIAKITLAETPLGSLSIEAVRSKARAFHDGDGFGSVATTDVGRLVLTPPVGEPQVLPLPSADQPVTVPGLAEIRIGPRSNGKSANGAFAKATGLVIRVFPSDTTATVGLARAKINDGVESLLFRGSSSGLAATGLDGVLTKGRTPLTLMPCQGTLGKLQTKSLAGIDAPGLEIGALTSEQKANQKGQRARAFERGSVASINLGDGALVVDGIVGQANLRKDPGTRNRFTVRGTTVGRITAGGEPQTFPDTGVLEIPGVARLEPRVVTRTKQTISVVALRITLLDGTGAVIDLGNARIGGKRSGR